MGVKVGDKLRVLGPLGFYHYGIYVGPRGSYGEDVVHNDKNGGVELVHFADFVAGRAVQIAERTAQSWYEQEEIVARALSLIGREYRLVDFNCEHVASYALTGAPVSPAVRGAVVLTVVSLVFWAAAKS